MLEGPRAAVVVGINNYGDNKIYPLEGPENDAKEIFSLLTKSDINSGLKFEIKPEWYLVGQQATAMSIRRAISEVLSKKDPTYDLIVVYFSGHGFADAKNGYIAPYDMVLKSPFACGINMYELERFIDQSAQKESVVVMILDCCYSGIATRGERPGDDFRQIYEQNLAGLSHGEGRITISSTEANFTARERSYTHDRYKADPANKTHTHGVFSFHFIEGLNGAAESNNKGEISLSQTINYVEQKMEQDGAQKLKVNMIEASRLEELQKIMIAFKPESFNKTILELRTSIIDSVQSPTDIRTVKNGADMLAELIKLDPQNQDIGAMMDMVKLCLQTYEQPIMEWLNSNSTTVGPQLTKRSGDNNLYGSLYNFVGWLDPVEFAALNLIKFNTLAALWDVTNGTMKPGAFISVVAPVRSPKPSVLGPQTAQSDSIPGEEADGR